MNYNNPKPQRTAGIIKMTCGFLFVMFSFCYLYFLRGDVLAEAQHSYSNGLTSYSIFVGALLITIVLQLVQWLLALFVRFGSRWYALSYLPSFLMLAMLTDVNEDVIDRFSLGPWLWVCPIVLVLYVFAVLCAKRLDTLFDRDSVYSIFNLMWPNYVLMLVFTLVTGSIPDTTDVYNYELKTERLISEKKWKEAAEVGRLSYPTSERLTQLRMYALSRMDSLGDCLFDYPQRYGVNGLLNIKTTDTTNRVSTSDICSYLGAHASPSIASTDRFLQLLVERGDSMVRPQDYQYYLCGLLLDKKLDAFRAGISKCYGDTLAAPLPRAYQEALLVGNEEYKNDSVVASLSADSIPQYLCLETIQRYHDYYEMKDSLKNKRERINLTRRAFGKTFWWYLDN